MPDQTPTVSDMSPEELRAVAEATELFRKIAQVLGEVEAYPQGGVLHITSEVQPGYLGWIGYNENGDITFQAASRVSADV